MSMRAALTAHATLLAAQYTTHLPNILELQTVFLHDILPALADELDLDAPAQAAARAWLQDTITLFHIARRNQWTRSCAMDAVRKTLVWRLEHLPVEEACSHVVDGQHSPAYAQHSPAYSPPPHLLPHPDPAGRPVLVLKLRDIPPRAHRGAVIRALERLRAHLCRLNHERPEGPGSPSSPLTAAPSSSKVAQYSSSSPFTPSSPHTSASLDIHSTPALQYLLLLDLSTASLPSLDLDLITWTLRDASPKFPGLVAGVLVLNYSWAHAGLWGVAKRLIPEAGSGGRVWFPTTEELVDWFGEAHLPEEYGGKLRWPPPSTPSPDRAVSPSPERAVSPLPERAVSPLPERAVSPSPERAVSPSPSAISSSTYTSNGPGSPRAASPSPPSLNPPLPRAISLSPLSILNPFFGYPARSHHHPVPSAHDSRSLGIPPHIRNGSGLHHRRHSHSLSHGRRRRRDLAKTLLWLFWARWGTLLTRVAWAVALGWAARGWGRILGVRPRTAKARRIPRTADGRRIPQREWDALLALAFTGFGAGTGTGV